MPVCKKRIIGLIAAISVYSTTAFCATVGQEKETLAALNNTLTKLNTELSESQSRVGTQPSQADKAKEELALAEQEHVAAQKELERLKQLKVSSPSEEVDRDLMLQENKTRFASRAKDREQRELDRILSKQGKLGDEVSQLQAKINTTTSQIERQERRVTEAQIEARAQELAASAPKPVVQAPVVAAPKPAAKPKVTPQPKPVIAEKPAAPVEPAPAQVSLSDYDKAELERIRSSVTSINDRIANPPVGDSSSISNLSIKGTGVRRSSFEYAGNDIYRTETVMKTGTRKLSVGNLQYIMKIPEADNGETYVFYYDVKQRRNPVFLAFKKSLLDQL